MPAPPILPVTTQRRAELHEALHLRLSTLYRDVAAMAARRPGAKLVESVRIVAEGLLADCAPFTRQRGEPAGGGARLWGAAGAAGAGSGAARCL